MNKRIRVLYTIPNFNTAGSGKVVYDLVNGIDKTKFDIEIACGNNAGYFFKTVKSLGCPIHIIETKKAYKPFYSLLPRVWKTAKFFKKQKYDIIHSWQWSSDWTEALAAKLAGIKWMYTKKAMGFNSKHWKIKSYLADFIVTVNSDMKNFFPYKQQQELIPFGLDTSYYNSDLFDCSRTSDVFKIITVANLVEVKNIEIIIKAIHLLNDAAFQLDIVGDDEGFYADALKLLVADLKLKEQICFLGKLPDVRPLLAQANLYIISSRQEGMPMALVEAMSMGIPVLGANSVGVNYVLKDFNDLLFPITNEAMLSKKIKDMKNKTIQERRTIGIALRTYCKTHFSIDIFINNHEYLYKTLVKKH